MFIIYVQVASAESPKQLACNNNKIISITEKSMKRAVFMNNLIQELKHFTRDWFPTYLRRILSPCWVLFLNSGYEQGDYSSLCFISFEVQSRRNKLFFHLPTCHSHRNMDHGFNYTNCRLSPRNHWGQINMK